MADPPSENRFTMEFPALHRRAYGVAYRLLGLTGPAEDIAQETLARAYARWARIGDDPTGWCVTVAFNLTMDQLRTAERDRRRHRQLIAIGGPTSAADPYVAERLDLYAALRALPRRQRQIVALRWIGDLSEAQTAQALVISLGSLKSQASRGLDALRSHLILPSAPSRSSHV
jgi:RNA polymerase sigma factor (sigma-70 family)